MNRLVAVLFLLAGALCSYAQQENIWAFGEGAGLDFNGGGPAVIATSISSMEAAASVCGADGGLLFYTDGTSVWDRTGALMPDGSALLPWGLSSYSTSQGAVIVPDPANPMQYYLFSLTSKEMTFFAGRLYYSKIDMTLNGGMGDVVAGQKGIFLDSMLTEKMGAVRGDNCNYWLMVCGQDLTFRAYQVTGSGIGSDPVLSPVAIGTAGFDYMTGNLAFAPGRHRLAITQTDGTGSGTGNNGASLYDFDPATGMVSDPINLLPQLYTAYGICFSPDNSKLYVNVEIDSVYQYDVSTTDPATILASKKGIVLPSFYYASAIRQGPDNKLYMRAPFDYLTDVYLAAINDPNLPAPACGWEDSVLSLSPAYMRFGLGSANPAPLAIDTTITVQSDTAPCFSINPAISAGNTGGYNYEWNTGAATAAIPVTLSGTYWVRYNTSACSYQIDTIHFALPYGVLPQVNVLQPCKGMANGKAWATAFAGDTVQYQYTWLNQQGDTVSLTDTLQSAAPGNYILDIRTNSCDTQLVVSMAAISDTVSFTASDTLACTAEAISFQNTSGAYYTSFSWTFGDDATSTIASPAHSYTSGGTYTIQLAGTGEHCSDTAYQTIAIDTPAVSSFTADRDRICTGESIRFTTESNPAIISQSWEFGDGAYIHNTLSGSLSHAYDIAGTFPVSVTTYYRVCPETTSTDSIYVFPMPVVNLGQDTALCLGASPIYLQNTYNDTLPVRAMYWNTGDTASRIKVVHPGSYSLTVTAEPIGCSSTDEVEVKKDCYIDVPNAFSPNGDGVNDYFFPRQYLSKKVTQFRMQILNRWGQVVFETTSIEGRGWDGRFNNADQPAGVYVYMIDVTIDDDRREHYEGNITLLR